MGEVKLGEWVSAQETPIPTKPRSRSVPDVAVLSSQTVKVCLLSADVFQGASFGIGVSCAALLAVLRKENLLFYCL